MRYLFIQLSVRKPVLDCVLVVVCLLAAASMWSRFGVVDRVPEQFEDVVKYPHGIYSDLYPRWLGARELLLRGRDPYGPEVTREIQEGFYGRSIRPGAQGEPKDEARFAYPVYVVFFLAPTVMLPFSVVKALFYVVLVCAAIFTAWSWIRIIKPQFTPAGMLIYWLLWLGSWAVSDAIHMQQPSLIVCAVLSGAVLAYTRRRFVLTGILLAAAMIKPQMAIPLAAWLMFLAIRKWHEQKSVVISFGSLSVLLLAGSEVLLPGWISQWLNATADYTRYTESVSITVEVLGSVAGIAVNCFFVGFALFQCWKFRNAQIGSSRFAEVIAIILSGTMALSPVTHAYDQIYLLPAIVVIVRAVLNPSLATDKRILLSSFLVVIGSIWIFAMLLAISQFWMRSFTRLSLTLMLGSMVLTPLAALIGVLLTNFWSRTHLERPSEVLTA